MRRLASLLALGLAATVRAADPAALALEFRIPLGEVQGRIDHLALDVARQRLYVAELGHDTLGVIDLKSRKILRTISGFKEPQAVGYEPGTDTVYVANAGDGAVDILRGGDLAPLGRLDLGSDADNIRVDTAGHRVYVGHASGALAVIDAMGRRIVDVIHLKAHPEGFQLDPAGPSIWVNVPDRHEIAVVDRLLGRQTASWPMPSWGANFPMALEADRVRVVVAFRHPDRLGVFDGRSGQPLAAADSCGDADDVFVDPKRRRIYVICGEGYIEVFDDAPQAISRSARIETASGARTGLYSAELDRLFLAVRTSGASPAGIWVFRPLP